ncbi:CoA transferase [Erythrobacter sp. SCSIO 43205]|uniref:CaiB/BaiF CoA transferase family protein n=1 Tax=Erythrobacter sp. SCSIO 43205 TaxID=2779361 RepID=UPI001CA8C19A|nr:CoA transferase [Erythrobacter sp. SCSIO 43205]UAB78556.1 CoA transferase [Erythrobacter sp. SCSIO 43205]
MGVEPNDGQPMLSGLKVIDLTSVVFGPYATQILADYGAQVTKIEAPGGDVYRYGAKPAKTPGMGPGFIALNRGKKSVMLDLKRSGDVERLQTLLQDADVFIHNVREDAIGRLGFDYNAVRALNPEIIYVHCVGFGSGGPYAGLQAYDDVIQAASGTTSLLPRVDGNTRPRYLPSLIADKVAGLHAAYAVMAAITHRLRTGRGQRIEVPMLEAFTSFMMKEHLDGKTFDPPNGDAAYGRQVDPNRQPFETKDGWISIVPYILPHFPLVVGLLGDKTMAEDERWRDPANIVAAAPELYARIGELTLTKTTDECVEILRAANIPCMPAVDLNDVIHDPHLNETGFFERCEHPSEGALYQMRDPNRFSDWQQGDLGHAPRLGEHNDES